MIVSQQEIDVSQLERDPSVYEAEEAGEETWGIRENITQYRQILVPLSLLLQDMYRDRAYPLSSEMWQTTHRVLCSMLRAFPDLGIRGSLPIYAVLRLLGIERHGTMSTGIDVHLASDLRHTQQLLVSQQIAGLVHASDIDLVAMETDTQTFGVDSEDGIVPDLLNSIEQSLAVSNVFHVIRLLLMGEVGALRKPSSTGIVTRHSLVSFQEKSSGKGRADLTSKRKPVVISPQTGWIGCIPYLDLEFQVGRHTVLTIGITPQKHDEVQDTRLNPVFSLSWDVGVGSLSQPDDPNGFGDLGLDAGDLVRNTSGDPGQERLSHHDGVFVPAVGVQPEEDVWIGFESAVLSPLTKPMEVGAGFEQLPIDQQVITMFRAVQRGCMGQEMLRFSEEGRSALTQYQGQAPALSRDAVDRFRNVSVGDFNDVLQSLSEEKAHGLIGYIRQYFLSGLFYHARFVEYASQVGLFRFFPELRHVSFEQWQQVIECLPVFEAYAKAQHRSTHWWETRSGVKSPHTIGAPSLFDDTYLRIHRGKLFQNPYLQFVQALIEAGVISINVVEEDVTLDEQPELHLPHILSQDGRYLSYLDVLLRMGKRVKTVSNVGEDAEAIVAQLRDKQGPYLSVLHHNTSLMPSAQQARLAQRQRVIDKYELNQPVEELHERLGRANSKLSTTERVRLVSNVLIFLSLIFGIYNIGIDDVSFLLGLFSVHGNALLSLLLGALSSATKREMEMVQDRIDELTGEQRDLVYSDTLQG